MYRLSQVGTYFLLALVCKTRLLLCACALRTQGTPKGGREVGEVVDHALKEAKVYRDCGLDGVIVENMHDTPYLRGVGPEVTACMSRVCVEVKQAIGGDLPLGVQILAGT